MVSTVTATGNADIDGILRGLKHDHTGTVTFAFPTSDAEYLSSTYTSVVGFQAFTEAQKVATRLSFDMINSYIAQFNVVETTSTNADFRLSEANSYTRNGSTSNVTTALGFYPSSSVSTDAWFNHVNYEDPSRGSFDMQAGIMHEIGHNMGLKHGHEAITGFPELPTNHNSYEYSVMTYHQYVGDTNGGDNAPDHATTYMINDIAALQYMYGADFTTQSSNTTYTWNPATGAFSINGVVQFQAGSAYVFQAVWDGGGNDSYNLSNFSINLIISLAPGGVGIVMPGMLADLGDGHTARASVYNAYVYNNDLRSLIENAYGGGGSDTIYGNQASNYLFGNGAADSLVGNAGADALYGGLGNDYIYGGTEGDLLDGADGNDSLSGDAGNDIIYGGANNDALAGGAGSDTLYGGDQNDTLWGHDPSGAGDLADSMYGGNGDDNMIGHTGNDQLYGGAGQDTIDGGGDNDLIAGDGGNDNLFGGGGADKFYYAAPGFGADKIWDFNPAGQTDRIWISTSIFANYAQLLANSGTIPGGGGTLIAVPGGGDSISLQGFGFAAMNQGWFVFF